MNELKILDNFFDEKIINEIMTKVSEFKLECCCIEPKYMDRYSATAYWFYNVSNNIFFSETITNIIKTNLKCKFTVSRINLLSQTYGQDCSYHVDHDRKNLFLYKNGQDYNSNETTFCIYLNKINKNLDCDGNLYFKTDEKHIICVEPLFNRAVLFPGYLIHCPHGFSIDETNRRLVITWKFSSMEYL